MCTVIRLQVYCIKQDIKMHLYVEIGNNLAEDLKDRELQQWKVHLRIQACHRHSQQYELD